MNTYLSLAAVLAAAILGAQGTYIRPRVVTSNATSVDDVLSGTGADVGVNLGPRSSFKKVLQKPGVTKWTQTIGGIPVYDSVLTTHNDDLGIIKQVQGFVSETASFVDTTPQITGGQALDRLKAEWNHTTDGLVFRDDEAELQILQSDNGFDKLIFKVSYYVERSRAAAAAEGPIPAYIVGLVNAHSGVVEESWENLQNAKIRAVTGNKLTGKSYHNIDVEKTDAWTCKHRDAVRRIEVFDIWDRTEITSETTSSFQCNKAADDNWDLFSRTDSYSPRNDAFLHATRFVDMWNELIGDDVKPYRTDTSFLRFYIHYGQGYENAFFDGDSFKFGDGKSTFYPLTSLDIVCHEIGHSVTGWHGGNMEYRKQSGGMNEAYSDILGETCDNHYNNRVDGLIAEDIMRPGSWLGKSMRDMCNPDQAKAPALAHFSQYTDNVGVHYSSGIYNKAWCTLKNTRGWDYIKAFKVFTDANLFHWKAKSTMACGACGVESAAEQRGYRKADVTAAFNAVGVSCGSCR